MKKLLLGLLASLALSASLVNAQQAVVQSVNNVFNRVPTYIAATGTFTLDATPTDACLITGSATKTVYVKKVSFSGLKDTAGALLNVNLSKRTAANSGGTAVAATEVAMDSSDSAATAVVTHYTADPTVGAGTVIWSNKVYFGLVTENAGALTEVTFGDGMSKYIVLRGVAQGLAVALGGQTISGGTFQCHFEWLEY